MKKLIAFLIAHKVDGRLLPMRFKAYKALDEIRVVSKLRIYYFYILSILLKQISHLKERLLHFLSERSNCLTLGSADSSNELISHYQDLHCKIISSMPLRIWNWIDLSNDLNHFLSNVVVFITFHENFSFAFFLFLNSGQFLLNIYSISNESSSVCLDQH